MNLSLFSPTLPTRRPRNLAMGVVDSLADRIRDGSLACGDKLATESALMTEFGSLDEGLNQPSPDASTPQSLGLGPSVG